MLGFLSFKGLQHMQHSAKCQMTHEEVVSERLYLPQILSTFLRRRGRNDGNTILRKGSSGR